MNISLKIFLVNRQDHITLVLKVKGIQIRIIDVPLFDSKEPLSETIEGFVYFLAFSLVRLSGISPSL